MQMNTKSATTIADSREYATHSFYLSAFVMWETLRLAQAKS